MQIHQTVPSLHAPATRVQTRPVGNPIDPGPIDLNFSTEISTSRQQRAEAMLGVLRTGAGALRGFYFSRLDTTPSVATALVVALLANIALAHMFGLETKSVAVIVAVSVASFVGSIAGFAFSAICGGMLFHLIDAPVRVVQIMVLCSIANQILMNWSLRDAIAWRRLVPILLGGLAALPVGLYLLMEADRVLYTEIFGALLILYGGYKLLHPTLTLRWQHPALDVLAGCLGGVTGGAAAFPSAFLTIWCSFKGWSKERQRSLYQPFILLMQLATVTAIAALRFLDVHASGSKQAFVATDLIYVPAGLLGTWCGMACFARLNDRQFARCVNVLLLASGASFIL